MPQKLALTYYSDILCIWAYISQPRLDEVAAQFPDQVAIDYRFCSVFGDTAHKIGTGWAERGGYQGFADHVRKSASGFDHIRLHPDLWQTVRPASSTPAHLLLKAIERVDRNQCPVALHELRTAFFEHGRNIAQMAVLLDVLAELSISADAVLEVLYSGAAHADLEADRRSQQEQLIQGSPTILLNQGRQKLYGNVGYTVIEANINELLRTPAAGAASWC